MIHINNSLQYDVDLVISSHNQYYERTYPILYNEKFEKETSKKVEPKPIITQPSQSDYLDKDNGIIFLTVGTAGDELEPVKERPNFYVHQESKFGFLEIEIENHGKKFIEDGGIDFINKLISDKKLGPVYVLCTLIGHHILIGTVR